MRKIILFMFIFLPALASADEAGSCGDNIIYKYDSSSKPLNIRGQGRMRDYSARASGSGIGFVVNGGSAISTRGLSSGTETRPWEDYKSDIKHIIVAEGVTYIGEHSFDGMKNLESVVFPSSLNELGHTSFNDCSGLLNIYCHTKRVPEYARDGLDTSSGDCKLYVPASSVYLYKQYFDDIFQKNGSKYFRYIDALQDSDPLPIVEEFVVPFDYTGYVLCDDHQIMSLENYKAQLSAPHSVRAVGVIFSTASQNHKTLAVTLFENGGVQFSNYTPLYCNTSCSVDAFDGYQNSVSLKNTYEEVRFKVDEPDPSDPSKTVQNEYTEVHCSPLGLWVDASHQYGQSDYIPSYAECRLLYKSVDKVNATIRALGGEEIAYPHDDGSVHRIMIEFDGNTSGLDADIWITAVEGVDGYSDIFMDGVKVNEMPGAWSNADENPKIQNYDLTSSADCNLMTATVSLYGKNVEDVVTVTLNGYVNGVQKNMKVIEYRPGESRKTISFTADYPDIEFSRIRSEDRSGYDYWYWTSTEDEVDKENRAWLCSMKTGAFMQTPKTQRHRARTIIALDYTYTSNLASPKQDRQESKVYYSLSGQRVTNPKPGINIQGGRKVVIK